MRQVWVTAAEVACALGDGVDAVWEGLLAGRSGIAPVTRFPTAAYASGVAACVPGLAPAGEGSALHGLVDRVAARLGPLPAGCRLLTATTKGGIDTLERRRRGAGGDAADAVLPRLLAALARRFGIDGPVVNVSAACASSTLAVARGAAAIALGTADAVLVCGADLVTEFVFSGFSALRALSPGPCRPFDRDRAGLTLGEGAAAVLLMDADRARREGRPHLGTVAGWGAANDANHVTAPARDGCGLVQAARAALDRAGLGAGAVAAVSAHGTGTVHNDGMELVAFRTLFGGRPVPIHSIKGAVGHTLGAAGAIEVAVGLKTLASRTAPPTAGLEHPAPGADGWVSREAAAIAGDYLLSTNSGFGGVNGAVVLARGADG